jgi:sugar O-acyltransferase (sialic acid O-acetyltransferase NeuD family)
MKEIILVGGGGHCKSVIDVIEQEAKYKIAGIIDKKELIGNEVLGYKVIGCDDDLAILRDRFQYAVITVGHVKSNTLRVKLFRLLKKFGFEVPTIISPLAYVSKHAFVDEGSIVMHHALVNPNAKIGKNCIINSKALVEHDAVIEDNCHIATGAIINGGTVVRSNTFYGSNTTSKECVEVSGFVKAGSVVK